MKRFRLSFGAMVAAASVLAAGAPALAQQAEKGAKVPDGWAYEIRNGKRVPRGTRIAGPDGSWKEQRDDGQCITVREQTAPGVYREVRKCN